MAYIGPLRNRLARLFVEFSDAVASATPLTFYTSLKSADEVLKKFPKGLKLVTGTACVSR